MIHLLLALWLFVTLGDHAVGFVAISLIAGFQKWWF